MKNVDKKSENTISLVNYLVCYSKEMPDLMTEHFIAFSSSLGFYFNYEKEIPPSLCSFRACRGSSCILVVVFVCCFVINQTCCHSNILWSCGRCCIHVSVCSWDLQHGCFLCRCLSENYLLSFGLIQACFLFHYRLGDQKSKHKIKLVYHFCNKKYGNTLQ